MPLLDVSLCAGKGVGHSGCRSATSGGTAGAASSRSSGTQPSHSVAPLPLSEAGLLSLRPPRERVGVWAAGCAVGPRCRPRVCGSLGRFELRRIPWGRFSLGLSSSALVSLSRYLRPRVRSCWGGSTLAQSLRESWGARAGRSPFGSVRRASALAARRRPGSRRFLLCVGSGVPSAATGVLASGVGPSALPVRLRTAAARGPPCPAPPGLPPGCGCRGARPLVSRLYRLPSIIILFNLE